MLRSLKDQIALVLDVWERSSDNLMGLDVGHDLLRLIKINTTVTPNKIEIVAIEPLPTGVIVKDEIKDSELLSATIRKLVKKTRTDTRYVAICIPRSIAIVKNVNVDSRFTAGELESRAWIEAKKHFPDLVGDIYLDFTLGGISVQDPSQSELILVACRKEQINPYLNAIRKAGLVPKIVDVNSYALDRALSIVVPATENQTVALLNLNLALSTFIVKHKDALVHSHDENYDGQRLRTQTQEYLKTHPQATLEDPGYQTIFKENFLAHLRHSMHFFYSSRPHIGIQKIFLAGDCANIPYLANFIQNELSIPTELADPFGKLTFMKTADASEVQTYSASFMQCCGLALSKME